MFRLGARTFATTARRAAQTVAEMEAPNAYGITVSKAQGVVKGLTGGKHTPPPISSEGTGC
jgi:cysteine synthase A